MSVWRRFLSHGRDAVRFRRHPSGVTRPAVRAVVAMLPALTLYLLAVGAVSQPADPLPSWNDGSTGEARFELRNGKPVLVELPKVIHVDDGPGKPVGINRFIGRRPVMAFGNSDGDHQMLQWTAAGAGLRFMGLVRHTDAAREWAYDRQSHIGRLDKALDEATARGWTVVDMKTDWKKVYAFE
jgi:hypothetical protein